MAPPTLINTALGEFCARVASPSYGIKYVELNFK